MRVGHLNDLTSQTLLRLDLFFTSAIAYAIRTGMHRHASVIDRPLSFPTAVVSMFALGWSALSLLSASEKSVTLNANCETRFTNAVSNEIFLPSENALRVFSNCRFQNFRMGSKSLIP